MIRSIFGPLSQPARGLQNPGLLYTDDYRWAPLKERDFLHRCEDCSPGLLSKASMPDKTLATVLSRFGQLAGIHDRVSHQGEASKQKINEGVVSQP